VIDRWATDVELAVDLRARDGDAWALVYVRCSASMRNVARRRVGPDQADRVGHEVFAQFRHRPGLFDPERGSLLHYLLGMTRNRSIDAYRADAARRRRETKHFDLGNLGSMVSAEGDAIVGITTEELIMIIRMLPHGEREAIGMAFFRHLSYQQVAITLGAPEGTVKSRIRAGLARMRTAFGELGLDEEPPTISEEDLLRDSLEIAPPSTTPTADP